MVMAMMRAGAIAVRVLMIVAELLSVVTGVLVWIGYGALAGVAALAVMLGFAAVMEYLVTRYQPGRHA
jgi:hypothetical protein